MSRSYYDILGVEKTASQAEIKKIFRRKAIKMHPDKNPDRREEAAQEFQELSRAYEALSDPQKRKVYDQFGEEGLKQHGGGAPSDISEILKDLFGGNGFGGIRIGFPGMSMFNMGNMSEMNNNREEATLDIAFDVSIGLRTAYKGGMLSHMVKRTRLCDSCEGVGFTDGRDHSCEKCKGTGHVTMIHRMGPFQQVSRSVCEDCRGSGVDDDCDTKCPECNTKKLKTQDYNVSTRIRKGIENQEMINIQGEGNEDIRGNRGNIIIKVNVMSDETFTRNHNNLITNLYLTPAESLCGFTKVVKHIDNRDVEVCCNQTISNGDNLTLKGEGIYFGNSEGNGKRGDLIFKVIISEQLKQLSESDKKIIYKILTGKEYPNLKDPNLLVGNR